MAEAAVRRLFDEGELRYARRALFAPDYMATRIMELPSCRDLGGEAPLSQAKVQLPKSHLPEPSAQTLSMCRAWSADMEVKAKSS